MTTNQHKREGQDMNTTTVTLLVCGQCGIGNYYADPFSGSVFECGECGHHIAAYDVDLDPGEHIARTDDGALGYTTD